MLSNFTTRFAPDTEFTESAGGGFTRAGDDARVNPRPLRGRINKQAIKQPVCESIVILARRA